MIISADELPKHSVVNVLDSRLISGSFGGDRGYTTFQLCTHPLADAEGSRERY